MLNSSDKHASHDDGLKFHVRKMVKFPWPLFLRGPQFPCDEITAPWASILREALSRTVRVTTTSS